MKVMPQYKPTLESENPDSIYEYVNKLKCDLTSFDFPMGESSENRRVIQGLISFWHSGIAEPANLFIPSTPIDAKKQLELMQAELVEILERQDREFSNGFVPQEPGLELPRVKDSYIINSETQEALQNYIEEIKRVHDL
jgi:hypothetical protein